jgi:hypothetical protein
VDRRDERWSVVRINMSLMLMREVRNCLTVDVDVDVDVEVNDVESPESDGGGLSCGKKFRFWPVTNLAWRIDTPFCFHRLRRRLDVIVYSRHLILREVQT